jgi:predicted glutamine amidotransferase
MCGIVGYVGRRALGANTIVESLRLLQTNQEPGEETPVGGHGAGLAAWCPGGGFGVTKVGASDDPVCDLQSQTEREMPWALVPGSTVLLGHVRRASPSLKHTARYAEAAQPYVAACWSAWEVVGIHNGYATNYRDILRKPHHLESASVGPVDSEVIPHFLEELLSDEVALPQALDQLVDGVRGRGNTFCLAARKGGEMWVVLAHRGKTRGLTVWENEEGAVLFVSRKRCQGPELSDLITRNGYAEVISIGRQEPARFSRLWKVPC